MPYWNESEWIFWNKEERATEKKKAWFSYIIFLLDSSVDKTTRINHIEKKKRLIESKIQ